MTHSLSEARSLIREIPNFPVDGIVFQDLTPLLSNNSAFAVVIEALAKSAVGVDVVAAIEARGFIFGAALAHSLNLGFVPIRKRGKLPFETFDESYGLEYGTDVVQIHRDAIPSGTSVLLVDDVLATGGTLLAGIRLIERLEARVLGLATVLEITSLMGSSRIASEYPNIAFQSVFSI